MSLKMLNKPSTLSYYGSYDKELNFEQKRSTKHTFREKTCKGQTFIVSNCLFNNTHFLS